MGGGRWDDAAYRTSRDIRTSKGIDDFAYTKTASVTHSNLDPKRINSKPFGKLESRDSDEHPESNAVLVDFDVTGSNFSRAEVAQKKLCELMVLLGKYLTDPQVAIAANDDVTTSGNQCIQISDFESDIRIDEHLRNIRLIGMGGANDGESYDLVLYAAARKTVLDCFEKRGRKGYLFMYADEPIFDWVAAEHVEAVFGDHIQKDILIADIIEEARKLYHVFVLWPVGGYDHARAKYVKLLGEEYVITLQDPSKICEIIGITIGVNESKVGIDEATADLVAIGLSKEIASGLTEALIPLASGAVVKTVAGLPDLAGGSGADRL